MVGWMMGTIPTGVLLLLEPEFHNATLRWVRWFKTDDHRELESESCLGGGMKKLGCEAYPYCMFLGRKVLADLGRKFSRVAETAPSRSPGGFLGAKGEGVSGGRRRPQRRPPLP